MIRAGSTSIKSWILIYAGFMAAIIFAEQGIAMSATKSPETTPVVIQAEASALRVDPVVRRSDI